MGDSLVRRGSGVVPRSKMLRGRPGARRASYFQEAGDETPDGNAGAADDKGRITNRPGHGGKTVSVFRIEFRGQNIRFSAPNIRFPTPNIRFPEPNIQFLELEIRFPGLEIRFPE